DGLCARATPALRAWAGADTGPVVIVCHAGIVRAALAMALGVTATGLKFEVANLSMTRLTCLGEGRFAVKSVNVVL
ncbi:MAG: histidine phosphatase family protein, partial [Planctomycetota bacterium]